MKEKLLFFVKKRARGVYYVLLPLVLVVFNFFFKFNYITKRDISFDEPYSILFACQSLKKIIVDVYTVEPHPPLFNIILHFWIKLFGVEPLTLRLVPLFISCITVLYIFKTCRRYINDFAGVLASCFFIFSWLHIYISLEVRSYALLSMATAMSVYYLMKFLEKDKKASFWGLIISNALLIYSHYLGLVYIGVQGLIVICFLFFRDRKFFWDYFKIMLIVNILYSPIWTALLIMLYKGNAPFYMDFLPASYAYHVFIDFFQGTTKISIPLVVVCFFVVVFCSINKRQFPVKMVVFLSLSVLTFVLIFLFSYKTHLFSGKYVAFTSIPLYVFISYVFS
ncbi:MAG: glycosyltransferase family 39 protein, partial [Bacteroidales bacterium]